MRTRTTTPPQPAVTCACCGGGITDEVARVDEGRCYHVRCFRGHLGVAPVGLYECPHCETLGGTWSATDGSWITCPLCGGCGYLAIDEAS
jgi:hypothetical protein